MDSLEYIDNYYQGPRSPEETRLFEQRILEDPAFAQELAFYLSSREAAKDLQSDERNDRFRDIYKQQPVYVKARPVRKLSTYIAAAAVLAGIIFGIFTLTGSDGHGVLADKYIVKEMTRLPVSMGKPDSMETGLNLYNDQKFPEALNLFERILQSDSSNFTAARYAGIAALRLKEYDKALNYFTILERAPLHANPALLYEAITLMKRANPGDDLLAKKHLEQIRETNLAGKETASKWLNQW